MVAAGELGDIRLVTGHYHQDWLSRETDWNWRLETDAGGALRSVGDIGTHWVDLTSFIAGQRPSELLAELTTFIPERRKPTGPVETFSAAGGATEPRRIETDDAAQILLRYPNGAKGAVTISQVSVGRKNAMLWDIAGARASASWFSETPEQMWIGHRDRPNQVLQRDPSLMNALGARRGEPAGRPRRGLRRHLLRALPAGLRRRRRGRAAGGLDLGQLRGRPLRDAVLRRGAAERPRGPLGAGGAAVRRARQA